LDAAAQAEQHPLQQEVARALRRSRVPDHDPQRSADRLALVEAESRLAFDEYELARYRSGDASPKMDERRRAAEIAERAASVQMKRTKVDDLRTRVGDPELVVDAAGYLPRERRELSLISFAACGLLRCGD
jgi:hypothetical protein